MIIIISNLSIVLPLVLHHLYLHVVLDALANWQILLLCPIPGLHCQQLFFYSFLVF